ncbi:N-6 DNA methylase [Kitasatospora sp. CM 4170]|uniref:N-6 DNA methylase n=1 Tax=Kitasatospora aburaviensis TaxID=67265 RepID=A0ABW1FB95_9ACTN|nr:N-6 DNA methylase [Kitasatospora sp. CM 4170]WNM47430.1 N-6 DNA methylase [Kitasatospora sp. CM 4170]
MPDRPEVTAVEIARLAGVGRAAVSNWRRRHADFPRPVGGTDASPTFALDEVAGWLRAQGKLAELPLLERVWQLLETLRDPDGHPAAPLAEAGAVLLLLHREPERWAALAAEPDTRLATALPRALAEAAAATLGPDGAAALRLPGLLGSTQLDLARLLARLAAAAGAPVAGASTVAAAGAPAGSTPAADAAGAFEQLLTRYAEANSRQLSPTPPEAAELLAAVAGVPATVLDPATGLGPLLLALPPTAGRYGQDADRVTGVLALLRLALHTPAGDPGPLPVELRAGDALRADGYPGDTFEAVLCQPPYNEREWGYDELQFDTRWPGGLVPPRGESELAWVLHCLAHTRPGGLAALLLPPTVATRRAGRRVRAELLRSGALRAVVALPAGAAPPYGVPLHLWVLRAPRPGDDFRQVLLLDASSASFAVASDGAEGGRDKVRWPELRRTVLNAWRAFDLAAREGLPLPPDRPGVHRAMAAIDLLDDETDLSPTRHVPPASPVGGAAELSHLSGRLTELLGGLGEPSALLPDPAPGTGPVGAAGPTGPVVTVGELVRSGVLELYSSGAGVPARPAADASGQGTADSGTPVLTDQDVVAGNPPSAVLAPAGATGGTAGATGGTGAAGPVGAAGELRTRPGDVLVPALGGGVARVVPAGGPLVGAALGRQLHLLRPDPAALDPEFLAGQFRSTASTRRAASHASTTVRLDIRRVELPRLPITEQRALGAAFARIAAFDATLQQAAALARTLTQALTDGLATGTLPAPAPPAES